MNGMRMTNGTNPMNNGIFSGTVISAGDGNATNNENAANAGHGVNSENLQGRRYTVLLVDDERLILDGITRMVDWSSLRTELAGTARNGLEAYERIRERTPDIVISDIRMPGMDGLELVAKTCETHPGVRFILLSGYGEFEYARQAMQYGVRHYLLKPTSETKIAQALREVVEELERGEEREAFVRQMNQRLAKVMPHVKEQVLKEFVINKTYGRQDWAYYRGLFRLEMDRPVRLVLLKPEGAFEYEHLFALKNIAEETLGSALLGTTIGDHALVLIEDDEDPRELHRKLGRVRRTFRDYYKMDVTVALSEAGDIAGARNLYQQTLQCLHHRFYLDEGGLITYSDTLAAPSEREEAFEFDEERLILSVRSGHVADAERSVADFFARLKKAQLSIDLTRSYVIQLYVSLLRLVPKEMNEGYRHIARIADMNSLQAMQTFLGTKVRDIARHHFEQNTVRHTAIVRRVLDIIEANLANADLSLSLVAGEMLYMNPDYLGKLFKKETGEKFSQYVMKRRIKKAVELIAEQPDIKIYELAERVGYGDNPQYFSQVFKKVMGCSPTEYMRAPEGAATKFDNSAF